MNRSRPCWTLDGSLSFSVSCRARDGRRGLLPRCQVLPLPRSLPKGVEEFQVLTIQAFSSFAYHFCAGQYWRKACASSRMHTDRAIYEVVACQTWMCRGRAA